MKKRDICSMILASAMTLTFFASCSDSAGPSGESPVKTSGEDETTAAETEAPVPDEYRVLQEFEKKDYSSSPFRVIAAKNYLDVLEVYQIPCEEHKGDVVNDALVYRDQLLSEYFGTKIEYTIIDDANIASYISKAVTAGDDIYDVGLVGLGYGISLIRSGVPANYYDYPDINVDSEYWNKNTRYDFELNSRLYMATGDITTRSVIAPFGMFFNKALIADYSLDSPYDLVDAGKWTFDSLKKITQDKGKDLNGDGQIEKKSDFFGLSIEDMGHIGFYNSFGERIISKENDELLIKCTGESPIQKIAETGEYLMTQDVMSYKKYKTYDANIAFRENRTLLLCCALCDMVLLRGMEEDFGIVPYPKYDEAQADYYSTGNHAIGTVAVIPKTALDTERVGTMMQATAAVSHYTSMPAEYDINLQVKQTRDEKGAEMLKLIVASNVWDWGVTLNPGSMASTITNCFTNGKDPASTIAKSESKTQKDLDRFTAFFEG